MAEVDGKIVGVLHAQLDEIKYLVVDEAYRKRGIGRMLLATSKKHGRWARVAPGNRAIIGLLESEGFYHDRERVTAGDWIAYKYRPIV